MAQDPIYNKGMRQLMQGASGLFSAENSRISNGAFAVLMGCAAIADLFSLIPLVGDIVGPLFWILVAIYLWKIGCGVVNVSRLVTEIVSTVAELIPVVQEFPAILLGMFLVILLIRFEDKSGLKVIGKKAGTNLKQAFKNENGIRLPPPGMGARRQPAVENGVTKPRGRPAQSQDSDDFSDTLPAPSA